MANGRGTTMYEQVANILRDRISYGIYPKNELLPPEMLLLAEFNVSRHTIREAMRMLVDEGLIERSPGRGTVVSPSTGGAGNWGIKSLNDLVGEFHESHVVVLKRAVASARTFPRIAELLGIRSNGSLFHIQRVMNMKEGPIALHRLYTHVKYSSKLPKEKIGHQTLIGLIEEYCHVQAFRTRQVASAIAADAEAAKLLGVRLGSPMLLLKRMYLTSDDVPIEYTELICRPDRYQQTVDFYRTGAPAARGKEDVAASVENAGARRAANGTSVATKSPKKTRPPSKKRASGAAKSRRATARRG